MLIPQKDVTSSIFIAVQLTSAVGAGVPSDREIFGDQRAAAATGLCGIARGHFDDGAASFFRFACTQSCQGSPGSIQDTFVQATLGGSPIGQKRAGLFVLLGFGGGTHILDLKILKHQCSIGVDQAARCFVQEILSTVPRLPIETRQLALGSIAPMTAMPTARELFVGFFDLLLGGAIDAGVVDDDAIGEHGIRLQAKINPDLFGAGMEGHRRVKRILDAKAGVPGIAIPLDRTGFDGSLDGAMHDHLEMPDFGERELARFLLVLLQGLGHPKDLIATLRVRETVIPTIGKEAGERVL
jgi:hypothetical protein